MKAEVLAALAAAALLCSAPAQPALSPSPGDSPLCLPRPPDPKEVPRMQLARSDVPFMYANSPEVYLQYGATVVIWGGSPWVDKPEAIASWQQRVHEAHDLGMRYWANTCQQTRFRDFMESDPDYLDSVCRTVEGEAIIVPWLRDLGTEDRPAYWFCTNSPRYRAFLKHQVRLAMSTPVEGLHIDGPSGTANSDMEGGCYCQRCMTAFRDYLKEHVDPGRLRALGLESLDGFDYAAFLRARGVSREQCVRSRGVYSSEIPLSWEFRTFQYTRAAEWVGELHAYAEQLAGRRLPLSVNSFGVSDPTYLVLPPAVTVLSAEVPHDPAELRVPAGPIFSFKMGDALGRSVACTAAGWDWAYVVDKNVTGLVRTWIAQAYAFGHQLMAPALQWCHTVEKGSHWYRSRPEDYAYLYRFVREHARLFDGYEAVAHVGVLCSNAALRRHVWETWPAREACQDLALRNVPVRLVLAGDDWMPNRLRARDLQGLKALVVAGEAYLDPDQQAVLDAARDTVVTWPDTERLAALAPSEIAVEGAAGVTVVPRVKPDDPAAPLVCHLLNRSYLPETDSMDVQRGFAVVLADSLFGSRITRATLHAPGQAAAPLEVEATENGARIAIPELDIWAVLELERDRSG